MFQSHQQDHNSPAGLVQTFDVFFLLVSDQYGDDLVFDVPLGVTFD